MSDIPKKVRIGYKDYTIREFKSLEKPDNDHAWGRIVHAEAIIRVEPTKDRRELVNTLLHEITHGICHTYNIKSEKEEELVTTMADGFSQVMRDNPDLIRWCLRNLK